MASMRAASPWHTPNAATKDAIAYVYEQSLSSSRSENDSFSSYLNVVRESFVPELGHPGGPARSSFQTMLSRRRSYDGELDVFGAEKYFSGGMDGGSEAAVAPVGRTVAAAKAARREVKLPSRRSRSKASAASTSSEASGNSRSMLLREYRQRQAANATRFLGVFPCSCSGKRATDVDRQPGSETAPSGSGTGEPAKNIDWVRDLRMERLGLGAREDRLVSFPPNLNLDAGKVAVGKELKGEEKFGGVPKGNGDMSSSSWRSLTLLTPVKVKMSGGDGDGGRDGGGDDDDGTGSESSSDLFEIKSLMINSFPYFEPEPSATVSAYEPSEASIEWSVVTASAADMSVASQHEDRTVRGDKVGRKAPRPHRPVGLLTGCASRKSVDVTTAAHKIPEKMNSEEPIAPPMRHHTEVFRKRESRRHAAMPIALSGGESRRSLFML